VGPIATAAIIYHVASRLAYVLYVGFALGRQQRHGYFTERWGVEGGFRRFRRRAAVFMYNDGLSFGVLCLATRGTWHPAAPRWILLALAALLIVVGVGAKLWAAVVLGGKAFYWYDFFAGPPAQPSTRGPYRWLRNPMYTVGYLQTYGFALLLASFPGLLAGLFDQVAILAFHRWVEEPHVKRWAPEGTLA
jgi:protein-S-isoprenylcysteine O-methyltransferase Ste14